MASKRVYLFDIDGTLANGDHRLHHIQKTPKDWASYFAACPHDEPIPHMMMLLNHLSNVDVPSDGNTVHLLFVSGRSDEVRAETEAWLSKHMGMHTLPKIDVRMRKQGDHRADDIIKIEILREIETEGYEVIMAVDDRNRVVDAWRRAGIPCAQVAPGDF